MSSAGTQLRDRLDCDFMAFEAFAAVQEDAKYAFGAPPTRRVNARKPLEIAKRWRP
jgi:hypothetical protein